MSCSFWNMRRRLRAQQQSEKVITDIAVAQTKGKAENEEKAKKSVNQAKKPKKRAGAKNDSGASNEA